MNVKYLLIIFFVLLWTFPVFGQQNSAEEYNKLIQAYNEYMEWENSVFQDLVFTLSDWQFKKGKAVKLILDDQLGRKWMFKFEGREDFAKSAGNVYRLFKLFGIDSPEVHYKIFNINGKMVSGSLQRFISNHGTLNKIKPTELPQNCLDYLLKTHVFFWLVANIDANPNNFIVIGLYNKVQEILHVDNVISWENLGSNMLQYDYYPPWWDKPSDIYYYQVWTGYISGWLDLALDKNYQFILFVADLPDAFFKRLITPEDADRSKEIPIIINRKHNLPDDFAVFYNNLAHKRGKPLKLSTKRRYHRLVTLICRNLQSGIRRLQREKLELQKMPDVKQGVIRAVVSQEAFFTLQELYFYYWKKPEDWTIELCDQALEKLKKLEAASRDELEKRAIQNYIEEAEKIKQTGKPTHPFEGVGALFDVLPDN